MLTEATAERVYEEAGVGRARRCLLSGSVRRLIPSEAFVIDAGGAWLADQTSSPRRQNLEDRGTETRTPSQQSTRV